ncbi:MAG: DUF1232 domain-containing protein [Lentisphaerae bacterium]|nr:DUF1232 domain-containing protein [Lentisphaerota bacterium]
MDQTREMNDRECEKVNEAYARGCENFTESQLDEVLSEDQLAHEKAAKLGGFFEEFELLWQMLKDYHSGAYRDVPWKFIAAAGFAVFYLLNPFDVIPDVLPVIGYVDDVAVFGLVLSSFKSEIEKYKKQKISCDNQKKGV